jgi:hypothetical protein
MLMRALAPEVRLSPEGSRRTALERHEWHKFPLPIYSAGITKRLYQRTTKALPSNPANRYLGNPLPDGTITLVGITQTSRALSIATHAGL